jgi:hypothetical protein
MLCGDGITTRYNSATFRLHSGVMPTMRIITNKRRIQRSRTLAQVLFFISIAILMGGLLLTNTITRRNDILLFVPCLIMPIGLITTLISVRMTNQFIRTPHPEDALADGLKGVPKNSNLYNYVLKPNHVLVSPQGIFTLTTRFHEGKYKVEGEKWHNFKQRGPLAPLFIFLRQEHLSDPFGQARKEAQSLHALVEEILPNSKLEVQPVVVFISPKVELEIIDPAIPVVYADAKQKPSLKSLLKSDKTRPTLLTEDQIRKLDESILALVDASGASEPDDEDE